MSIKNNNIRISNNCSRWQEIAAAAAAGAAAAAAAAAAANIEFWRKQIQIVVVRYPQ